MKKYKIVNEYDANQSFIIEAPTPEDAAFEALKFLGWWVADGKDAVEDLTSIAR